MRLLLLLAGVVLVCLFSLGGCAQLAHIEYRALGCAPDRWHLLKDATAKRCRELEREALI